MNHISMITLEKLLEMKTNNEPFKLVDVLDSSEFAKSHIPGAVNVSGNDFKITAEQHLDKNETVIVYCGSYSCGASSHAARTLMDMGYTKVLDFKAGKAGWMKAGLKLES